MKETLHDTFYGKLKENLLQGYTIMPEVEAQRRYEFLSRAWIHNRLTGEMVLTKINSLGMVATPQTQECRDTLDIFLSRLTVMGKLHGLKRLFHHRLSPMHDRLAEIRTGAFNDKVVVQDQYGNPLVA